MSKQTRRLVVDASVVFGSSTAPSPSRPIRWCLDAILQVCHRVVMTPDIRKEWRRHASVWCSTWLTAMTARRKAIYDVIPQPVAGLLGAIEAAPWTERKREKARKDVRLVEAAVATDNAVISCDIEARRAFSELAVKVTGIRQVIWVNPRASDQQCVEWLRNGAPLEESRQLGAPAREQNT